MPTLSAKQRETLKNYKPKLDPELERKLDALTDEDIRRAALDDPDCPPLSPEALKRIANRPGPTPPSFEERRRKADLALGEAVDPGSAETGDGHAPDEEVPTRPTKHGR